MTISKRLTDALSSKNGFVRKGARGLLWVPKKLRWLKATSQDLAARPPVLANSFPKSGTHLLVQISDGLPDRANYGAFLGSERSSFQLRERSVANTQNFIRGFVPGEVIRGHLYFDPCYAEALAQQHTVHYFVYRDPRAVVVSEAHYLREMNRWHKLHQYFRKLLIEDAIMLSIEGLNPPVPGISYGNIAERFARYEAWLNHPDCLPIKYEELIGEKQPVIIRQMAEFFAARCSEPFDMESNVAKMQTMIAPQKSHTFRSGKKAGWRQEFTAGHRQRFAEVAGDLLVRLGYEQNHDWARDSVPAATS